jgi:Zn-dependent membrane protease YugP
MMLGLDPLHLIMMVPALLLSLAATWLTRSTFKKYATVPASSGLTGAQAAERMMRSQGVFDVKVERVDGFLSDHYDPTHKVLRLSPDVYDSNSLSAIGVACHEAGHAMQHARAFAPLALRTALVPLAQFGSGAANWIILAGFLLMGIGSAGGAGLGLMILKIGIVCFSVTVVFSLVTLPVEWDASRRAKEHMVSSSIVSPGQEVAAGRVLNAAFLTYVAAAVSAVLTLLYYLLRSGLLGGRSSDD